MTTPDDPPVEQQREELAQTVDALTDKLDVRARAHDAAEHTVQAASATARDNRQLLIGVAAAVLAVGAVVVIRRRIR
ncbi:DUF3618 domain-containing protein [Gordonia sp. Z-3]|jgi:hypothetical protein|uniref:DUF3618 domain-containing protein n=1 Tax=Gordonia aquimaris TaxID=2984863 RepID=A0A9X3I3N0_9ACTN|nr:MULTISPECIES: DUF3618 domain-containing protein [Gordonia]MAU81470.1 deoxyuridine 5'-triphosphate nucleotidohydrolase [Gordonia sp. (in: high G+C Gram-positive bacteria)]MCX2963120.1 DUF3618 domain-containing protein [Gordonia aquimaris]MED5802137.1 DUF3618 domain-containing protein [Gordonia sp. Z-3]